MKPLPKEFYLADPLEALPHFLGKLLLVRDGEGWTGGRIVEVEAYLGEADPGSFAYKGRKGKRKEALYRPEGTTFVYMNYGMYFLLNIIMRPAGQPGAILIRAIEPIYGIEKMKKRRRREKLRELCSGPGKLCAALGIDMSFDNLPVYLPEGKILLAEGQLKEDEKIAFSGRIGIKEGAELPYRAFIKGSPFLSRPT